MQKIVISGFMALLLLWGSAPVRAQIAEAARPGSEAEREARPVQVDVDHASFAYGDNTSLVELYLAFEAATLSYVAHEQGFLAELPVGLSVIRSTQSLGDSPIIPVWSDQLNLSFVIADTSGLAEGQHFVHQVRAAIPPGEYELLVSIDGDESIGRAPLSLKRDVLVPDFSASEFVRISDVTLASSIEQSSNREDSFYKNGMLIRPNANQLFGSGLNTLYYYFEVYNLSDKIAASGKYKVFTYIADANLPQPLASYQKRSEREVRSPDVIVGTFNIKALPSGSYFLRIAILNERNESVAEQSRKFFVYNPLVQREVVVVAREEPFEISQYANMSEEEIDRMMDHIQIIASDRERRRIKGIRDLDERRRFFMDFWNVRDPDPATPVNEYQEQFYSLIQYANDRYTTSFSEGWDTDRGWILVKYAAPTAIEPHMFDAGFAPYEIWEYNNIPGEGQSQFIFADLNGFGSFELIHSTVSGERKLANWAQELRR